MAKRLSGSFVNLVYDAAVRSFHRRKALSRFLRQVGISENYVADWTTDESSATYLTDCSRLSRTEHGQEVILRMARDLAAQDDFLDLKGWENSEAMISQAKTSIRALRAGLAKLDDEQQSERFRNEARSRHVELQQERSRTTKTLQNLEEQLKELSSKLGTQEAGYAFQNWFYELMDFFEVQKPQALCNSWQAD